MLSTGTYPARTRWAEAEPYGGGSITYELRRDGSAIVRAPRAAELWRRVHLAPVRPKAFEWELPALSVDSG